jgi:hypothetical protein
MRAGLFENKHAVGRESFVFLSQVVSWHEPGQLEVAMDTRDHVRCLLGWYSNESIESSLFRLDNVRFEKGVLEGLFTKLVTLLEDL